MSSLVACQEPIAFMVKDGGTRMLGGMKLTDEVIGACLQRMQVFTRLAMHTLEAEFPTWDFIRGFSVFALNGASTGFSQESVQRLCKAT